MILKYAKSAFPDKTDEEAVLAYVDQKSSLLETDVYQRIYGITNKTGGLRMAGYEKLRDFYDGDQWQYRRDEGSAMSVVNFCRMTADNFTAFLTQEEPEIDIPPRDPKDDIENARVVEQEKLVKEVLTDNQFYDHWHDAAQNGSVIGDSMIVGPFWDRQNKRIWFSNVKKPELVRIVWQDENYHKMEGFLYDYYMSLESAERVYGELLKQKGIDLKAQVSESAPAIPGQTPPEHTRRVKVRMFFDEQITLLALNNIVLEYDEHNNGFIPLIYVRNKTHPTLSYGISDIEDLLDPQVSYNEQTSDMQDIIAQVAFASIFGKNLEVDEVQAGAFKVYDLGDESEVFNDPRNTNFPFLQTYLSDKKQDVDVISGLPDVFQGGKSARDVSGRALSVLMTPINNRIRAKEKAWGRALKELVKNILILMEKHVDGASRLIQGHYKVDIFFPGTLVRDVTEELNKFIQKVQSQYTTMKNIGIASPKDEQVLMKKELSDLQIATEISRNPQMQMALVQQVVNQARQKAGAQAEAGAAQPTLSEGQNQGGESPASAPGANVGTTVSPQGALQNAAAGSAPPIIPNA